MCVTKTNKLTKKQENRQSVNSNLCISLVCSSARAHLWLKAHGHADPWHSVLGLAESFSRPSRAVHALAAANRSPTWTAGNGAGSCLRAWRWGLGWLWAQVAGSAPFPPLATCCFLPARLAALLRW